MKHTNDALPDPRLLNPSLPGEIVQVLQSALAKDPQRRFQSAQALGRATQQVRLDALSDPSTRTGTTHPPISIVPPPISSATKQTTWHGQDFRDTPIVPSPEFPSGPAPVGLGGITNAPTYHREPPPLPPGWANAVPRAVDNGPLTWQTQGGRTAGTNPGGQQHGYIGLSPAAGGGPFPQHPVPKRGRSPLIFALIAAVVLMVVFSSVGVAAALGMFNSPADSQVAQAPSATTAPQVTGTPPVTATTAPTPAPTDTVTPSPSPTRCDANRLADATTIADACFRSKRPGHLPGSISYGWRPNRLPHDASDLSIGPEPHWDYD